MKKIIFTMLTLVLFTASALAQSTSGRLVGTVSGPDGVIPGATITVIDNQTKRETTVTTSGDGAYVVPLEFGTYTVNITAQGFKTFTATELKIDVNREYSLNPTLEVGGVEESVTVIAGADTVNSANGELSNTVSPIQIQELPLDGRSPLSLTGLQAGTSQNGAQGTSINGQRTAFTNITRDGINVNDNFIRANATDFSPERSSSDDTGEYTIVTQNAGAESGYGAAQVQLVTPRGQSEFNGALYIYNRNSKFAANSFFNNSQGRDENGEEISPRPFLNRNQLGGKISGPLPLPRFGEGGPSTIRGKAFFFFNYEKQFLRESTPQTRTVLNQNARNGIFTFNDSRSVTRSVNIFSLPTSGGNGAFPVPTGISPFIQSTILDSSPLPNSPGGTLNTGVFGISQGFNSDYDYYTTRIDVDINDRNTINGVYTDKREVLQRPDVQTNGFLNVAPVVQPGTNRFLALSYRYTSPGGFSNEARGGFSFPEAIFDSTEAAQPFFLNSALINEPTSFFLDQGRTQKNYNIQDNASLTLGNHSLRFGFLGQFFRVNPFNDAGIVPTFTLGVSQNSPQLTAASFASILPTGSTISQANVNTANSLLALLGGIVGAGQQTFNPTSRTSPFAAQTNNEDFAYENYAGYVSDQWRVTPQLTLNLGVRYELYTALRLGNGLLLEPIIPEGTDPRDAVLDPNGQFQFLGGNAGNDRNQFFKTDKNNFGPVISFAYAPQFKNNLLGSIFGGEGRTVIRGGYRISYVQDQLLTALRNAGRGNQGLGSTALSVLVNNSSQLNLQAGSSLAGFTPAPPAPFQLPLTFAQNNSARFSNFGTAFAIDPNLQNARTQEYNFGIQRELGFQTAIEVRYVGGRSNNLLRGVDFNQIDIFNNGLLADFNRARANLLANGNAFVGQPLTIFGTAASARIRVANNTANAVSVATFTNNLVNGSPAELALGILTSNADINTANGQFPLVPNPNVGVADVVLNGASYNYNSLQAEVRRRFAQGLYFQANYTFQKNLTNAIGTGQFLFEPLLDNNQPQLEQTRADFDQAHAFNFNTVYELPFGRNKRFFNQGGAVDKLLGGFQISTLLRYGSGAPITLVDPRGTLNRAARSARQTANSSLSKDEIKNLFGNFTRDGQRYFINPDVLLITPTPNGDGTFTSLATQGIGQPTFSGQVFFNVEPGQTGNLERGFINGAKQFNLDAAIIKNIQFTEGTRVQLRAEAFNLTNRTNFFVGQLLNINSDTFGQLTSDLSSQAQGLQSPRRLQFAARFEF